MLIFAITIFVLMVIALVVRGSWLGIVWVFLLAGILDWLSGQPM